jgi:hypothetical protein
MSKSISRVLYWMIIYLGHVFLHNSSHPLRTDGQPICPLSRCCSRWGLHGISCRQEIGELLPHLSTLTLRNLRKAVYFCCTFLQVTLTGSYPAPCPMEPGLSSCTTFRRCTRDHLAYSIYIVFALPKAKYIISVMLNDYNIFEVTFQHIRNYLYERFFGMVMPCIHS